MMYVQHFERKNIQYYTLFCYALTPDHKEQISIEKRKKTRNFKIKETKFSVGKFVTLARDAK